MWNTAILTFVARCVDAVRASSSVGVPWGIGMGEDIEGKEDIAELELNGA